MIVDNHQQIDRRLILLGASNLARGFSTVVAAGGRVWGRPLDILAASGHGRSYGKSSCVLGRTLPSILECGLWRALSERPPATGLALVTDIGNDIFYGAPVAQIADWVSQCVDRLLDAQTNVILTGLPVCNLDRVSPVQYGVMRRLFFPSCRLTFAAAKERAAELAQRVVQLAQSRRVMLIEPPAQWYGIDPIHIAWRRRETAWNAIFSAAQRPLPAAPTSDSGSPRWTNIVLLAPEQRWLWGIEQRRAQPCTRLADGSQLSLY